MNTIMVKVSYAPRATPEQQHQLIQTVDLGMESSFEQKKV